ncbi:lysine--tRNA ligase [Acidithiobacillus acidisediminis]|uniref:lysine--tRNA ligase n=1 Tax=Acidithiobacillus acidisediminis TaxID=2937799 RepID=UPI00200D2344|nr:lysine--tRNA ligase [Acidithiobacillus sp. S30A2]
MEERNDQMQVRWEKLQRWREAGRAYPNAFRRDAEAGDLQRRCADMDAAALEREPIAVRVGGRLMTRRVMGKASFADLQDGSGRLQLFLSREEVGEGTYAQFKELDLGDLIGVEGTLFRTKAGELSLRVHALQLLAKALRPLPEKWHGLTDPETRFRQRYVDLIVTEEARRTFQIRSATVVALRQGLSAARFVEVETPMMQPIPGGATAKPFVTHHHALDMTLYLRIAPELYLKRLVVGGVERVFEINRNFRNEGISTRHNPEFTMLEWYEAYADYHIAMDRTEGLIRAAAQATLGQTAISYQGAAIDLGQPFARLTVAEAVRSYNPDLRGANLRDPEVLGHKLRDLGLPVQAGWGWGKRLIEIFEKTVETQLLQPTFIIEYPTEVSPLARANDADPEVTDRFELFIAGRELANGFSELNDPEDQAARFEAQVLAKESGDDEAMFYDHDYIRALEYGMPPTAGVGMGIDRLVMLLADQPSIREVILFPHLRPEQG